MGKRRSSQAEHGSVSALQPSGFTGASLLVINKATCGLSRISPVAHTHPLLDDLGGRGAVAVTVHEPLELR
jgi:hypothetical protein